MDRTPPTVVLCLGLPGSASTWVFNVCLHLLGRPQRAMVAAYLDDRFAEFWQAVNAAEQPVEMAVLKSHKAEAAIFDFLRAHPTSHCILSVRDPRDCMVSLMERFDFSFEAALAALVKSCRALLRFQRLGVPLLRYEDNFFQSSQTIADLHRYLGVQQAVDSALLERLYSPASVRRLIATFDLLPADRIRRIGRDQYDLVSHWHSNHFGDGLNGKWHTRLSEVQKEQANHVLAEAIDGLGYREPVEYSAV